MKEQFQLWLATLRRPEGALALGVRLPTNACLTMEKEPFPFDRLHLALQLAAEVADLLARQNIGASNLTLRFDDGHLLFARRPDGAGLGILARQDADLRPVQRLVREFVALA